MLALVNNEPKVLSLSQILDHYIEHQKSVIVRRVKFDLEKALARAHILKATTPRLPTSTESSK